MVPKKPESMTTVDKIQQFFVLHGEKLGFGVVLLVLAWCLASVFTVETYQHQPEQLVQKVESKQQVFQNNDPANDQTFQQLQVVPYDQQARQALAFHVTEIGPFNRGVGVGKKRPDPELLPLVDLRAESKQASVLYQSSSSRGGMVGNQAGQPGIPQGPAGAGAAPGGPGGFVPGQAGPPGAAGFPPGMMRGRMAGGDPTAGQGQGEEFMGAGMRPGMNLGGSGMRPGMRLGNGAGNSPTLATTGAKPLLKHMVIITARVPLKEQLNIYRKAFKDCRITDPKLDFPNYFTFLIQRRDLTAGEKQWRDIQVRTFLEREVSRWVPAAEIVAPEHVVPLQVQSGPGWTGFTIPLPMLADESWGPEATTAQIPLLSESQKEQLSPSNRTNEQLDDNNLFPSGDFSSGTETPDQEQNPSSQRRPRGGIPPGAGGVGGRPGIPQGPGGPFSPPGIPGGRGVPGGAPQGMGMGMGPGVGMGMGPGTGMGMGMGTGTGMGTGQPGAMGYGSGTLQQRTNADILLRFIDMNVEGGHEYVYRVRLIVHNPNYGVNGRYLVNRESSKRRYRVTDWVELTEPVRVTVSREVIAGRVRRSPTRDRQSVMVVVRDPENGARVMAELRVYRGHLLNKTLREVFRKHPTHNSVEKLRDYPIQTNMLVLDFMGGRSVPGLGSRPVELPSQVLVMHEDGRLEVRSEVTEDVDAHYDLARKHLAELAQLAEGKLPEEDLQGQQEGQSSFRGMGMGIPGFDGGPSSIREMFDERSPFSDKKKSGRRRRNRNR